MNLSADEKIQLNTKTPAKSLPHEKKLSAALKKKAGAYSLSDYNEWTGEVKLEQAKATLGVMKESKKQKEASLYDGLCADGFTAPSLYQGAGKGKDQTTFYISIQEALKAGLPATVITLLNKDPKRLGDAKKAERRAVMQRLGNLMTRLKGRFEHRLALLEAEKQAAAAKLAEEQEASKAAVETKRGTQARKGKGKSNPPAPPVDNVAPVKAMIERLSTLNDVMSKVPTKSCSKALRTKILKHKAQLVEELSKIK